VAKTETKTFLSRLARNNLWLGETPMWECLVRQSTHGKQHSNRRPRSGKKFFKKTLHFYVLLPLSSVDNPLAPEPRFFEFARAFGLT
jgi:hypothetical protein